MNQKAFVCDYPGCGKKYSSRSGLQLHIRGLHKKEKKFVCTVEGCNRQFVRNNDLQMHIMRMHQQRKPYKCDVEGCGKTFVSQSELRKHKSTHTRYTAIPELQTGTNQELYPIELWGVCSTKTSPTITECRGNSGRTYTLQAYSSAPPER